MRATPMVVNLSLVRLYCDRHMRILFNRLSNFQHDPACRIIENYIIGNGLPCQRGLYLRISRAVSRHRGHVSSNFLTFVLLRGIPFSRSNSNFHDTKNENSCTDTDKQERHHINLRFLFSVPRSNNHWDSSRRMCRRREGR